MTGRKQKSTVSWSDVKTRLTDFDRAGLIGLIQDLYAASKDNRAFLHARFALGDDVLKPYKVTLDRWLWPDLFKNPDTSVAQAKKAISDYKKAIGQAEGLAELMVFYCERAAGFSNDVGLQDEGYFNALGADVRAGTEDHRLVARSEPSGTARTPGRRTADQPPPRLWRG